jgi:hypothetical protein
MTFAIRPPSAFIDDDLNDGVFFADDANTWRTRMPRVVDGRGGSYEVSAEVTFDTSNLDSDAGSHALVIGSDAPFGNQNLNLKVAARTVNRQYACHVAEPSADYTQQGANVWRQGGAGGSVLLLQVEKVPRGAELTSIKARWKGATVARGALPTLPTLALRRIAEDGTSSILATATDASATVGAYEAFHDLSWSTGGVTMDPVLYRYLLVFTGENTPNFVVAGELASIKMSFSVSAYSEF